MPDPKFNEDLITTPEGSEKETGPRSLVNELSSLLDMTEPELAEERELERLGYSGYDFITDRLTPQEREDPDLRSAITEIWHGSEEESLAAMERYPALVQLFAAYRSPGIPELTEQAKVKLLEKHSSILAVLEPQYSALVERLYNSIDFEECVKSSLDGEEQKLSLDMIINTLYHLENFRIEDFDDENPTIKYHLIKNCLNRIQDFLDRTKLYYPGVILDQPALSKDTEQLPENILFDLVSRMDISDPDSGIGRSQRLQYIFRHNRDFHTTQDLHPQNFLTTINMFQEKAKKRLNKFPRAREAIGRAVQAEYRRLQDLGVLSRDQEYQSSSESLFVSLSNPLEVTGLVEMEGYQLLMTEADIPNLLNSIYIDPNTLEDGQIDYARISIILPGDFTEGIDEIMFINPEDEEIAENRTSQIAEVNPNISESDLFLERLSYRLRAKEILIHEIFEHARFKFTFDEMQAFMSAIDADEASLKEEGGSGNFNWYVRFLRENADYFGEGRAVKEDLCDTAAMYITQPRTLFLHAPARYQFMLNLITSRLPEKWRKAYQISQIYRLELAKVRNEAIKIQDEDLKKEARQHDTLEKSYYEINSASHSMTGEYIITDGIGEYPKGKIVFHLPPYLKYKDESMTGSDN